MSCGVGGSVMWCGWLCDIMWCGSVISCGVDVDIIWCGCRYHVAWILISCGVSISHKTFIEVPCVCVCVFVWTLTRYICSKPFHDPNERV